MTRADRLTLVRQHLAEGLSQRAIARRLGVSKDTVRRDVERLEAEDAPDTRPDSAPGDEPSIEADDQAAPQVTTGDSPDSDADSTPDSEPDEAPPGQPVSPPSHRVAQAGEPLARLPRRMTESELVIDLAGWPALRRGLAVLAVTGNSPQALISQAVVVLEGSYMRGVVRGQIRPGRPFIVRDTVVSEAGPRDRPATTPTPVPPPPETA